MKFMVNGNEVSVDDGGSRNLLSVLRDQLHLTGTKNGCGKGDCGACTVLVDGEPVRSCVLPVRKAEGRRIVTIEGIGTPGRLHPLQAAFLKCGAVQCGFCTPGVILRAKALLDKNPSPSAADIKAALENHLCRCTGYQPIIEGIQLAARTLRGESSIELKTKGEGPAVGSNVIGIDSIQKVTGTARFAADLFLEGMLVAGVVRSPYHHALILDIDVSEAARMDGVEAIVTAKDIPGVNRTGTTSLKDQPILAEEKVRHLGEPIVAIAARDETVLKRAKEKVRVRFKELKPVFSPARAIEEGDTVHGSGNLLYNRETVRGDAAKGFGESAYVVEKEFSTGLVEHAYLEPEAGVAYRKDGKIYMYTGGQDSHFYQNELSRILGIERTEIQKLHIVQAPTGGGFGGKIDISVQGVLALLASRTDKPVKYVYSREESFLASTKRHPFVIDVKLGAGRDGRLKALHVQILVDTGAYASWGRSVLTRASVHATGPYEIPHVLVEGRVVYTNNPVCGAFRGFGVPQVTFAVESAMDLLANEIHMDPLEFRMLNAFREGSVTGCGQVLKKSVGILKCLEAVRPYYLEEKARVEASRRNGGTKKLGVGLADMWFGIGYTGMPNPSAGTLELKRSGRFQVYTGACDIGQGSNTVLWQIAAQSLGVSLEAVEVCSGDALLSGNTNMTCASRQTSFAGNALMRCGTAFRETIIKVVSEILEEPYVENIVWDKGAYFSLKRPEKRLTLKEVYRQLRLRNFPTKVSGVFIPEIQKLDDQGQGIPFSSYAFATHVAVVEVDESDRSIRVLKVIAAHDVGKAINPVKVQGQITGGVVMGLGYGLTEEYMTGETRNYKNYLIPTIKDMPEITPIIVEDTDPFGPFGAKGLGEPAMIPTAPAIANAVFDAIGTRPCRLPIKI